MTQYPEDLVVQLILALMEAAGVDEIKVDEMALVRSDPREHLVTYRNETTWTRTYRRVVEPEVLDGEEVPNAGLAITGGGA